jgi:3-hydroxybutyryl-CoA dehydrogenase
MSENRIVVIGAGTIGSDVALEFALKGYSVLLHDVSTAALDKAFERMRTTYRLSRLAAPQTPLAPLPEALARIQKVAALSGSRAADLVVENVTESFEHKKRVYLELAALDGGRAIYAANTSCISITRLGALMPAPDRVVGMHFMNPVPLSRVVELVRGYATSEETIARASRFVHALGKSCIVANDMPGFISNRVMMPMINESIWLLQDGVAGAAEVDAMFRQGFGHKMGPLTTADLIGLDTVLDSIRVLYESYMDPKFRPCPLLVKMVDAGLLGRKSGHGFFKY